MSIRDERPATGPSARPAVHAWPLSAFGVAAAPWLAAAAIAFAPSAAGAQDTSSDDADSGEGADAQDEAPPVAAGSPGADAPARVEAEDDEVAADDEEARALFQAGNRAYGQGRFERALEHFTAAYEASPRPRLLFNIANTRDRLGNGAEALDYFRRFLEARPEAVNRAFVEGRIRVLEASVETATEPQAASTELEPVTASEHSAAAGDSSAGVALLVVGGALVAGAIGTTIWWVDRMGAADECASIGAACGNPDTLAGERDAAMGMTIGLGVLGLVGVGVGAALIATTGSDGSPEAARVQCLPALGGLSCAGRF